MTRPNKNWKEEKQTNKPLINDLSTIQLINEKLKQFNDDASSCWTAMTHRNIYKIDDCVIYIKKNIKRMKAKQTNKQIIMKLTRSHTNKQSNTNNWKEIIEK